MGKSSSIAPNLKSIWDGGMRKYIPVVFLLWALAFGWYVFEVQPPNSFGVWKPIGPFIRLQFKKKTKNSALNAKNEITLKRKHRQTYQQKHLPPLHIHSHLSSFQVDSPTSFPGHFSATFPLATPGWHTITYRTSLTNGSFNCITSNVPGASSDPPPKALPKVLVKLCLRAEAMSYDKKPAPFLGY